MTPIETTEIRGISIKTIIWLVGCTVTIVSSVMITSGNISNKLETYIVRQDGINSNQDLRIKHNEDAGRQTAEEVRELRKQIEQLKK